MNGVTRRQLDFDNFDQVLEDARQLQAGVYQRAGRWNLGQMAEHLAMGMDFSMDGFPYRYSWFLRLPSKLILRHILQTRRVPEGMKLPRQFLPPQDITDSAGVAHLIAAIDRLERRRWPWAKHPYFGVLERDQWRQFHLIHCAHHLSFLRKKEASD